VKGSDLPQVKLCSGWEPGLEMHYNGVTLPVICRCCLGGIVMLALRLGSSH
jgi:hypothetical protein